MSHESPAPKALPWGVAKMWRLCGISQENNIDWIKDIMVGLELLLLDIALKVDCIIPKGLSHSRPAPVGFLAKKPTRLHRSSSPRLLDIF